MKSPTRELSQHLSAKCRVFLNFFPIKPTYLVPFHWVGNSGIFQPAPHAFAWVGISWYLSTSPTQCLDHERVCPRCFSHPQYLSSLEGAGDLLHHQIRLRISTNTGDSRTRRDLPKFVCTPRGGGWAQGAAAGTKAPVPRGVQSKEGSPLRVPLSVAITVNLKKRCTTWELWVKLYLGQNENCSPGASISDSSERLLQSSSGDSQ